MSQAAVLDRELTTAKTPPLARPKYPHCKAQPLIAPALGQTQFDRAKFSSPKLDRPMYNGTTGGNDAACATDTAPDRFAAAVVGQAIEVLMGHRPVRQLQTWLHPDVYDALARRADWLSVSMARLKNAGHRGSGGCECVRHAQASQKLRSSFSMAKNPCGRGQARGSTRPLARHCPRDHLRARLLSLLGRSSLGAIETGVRISLFACVVLPGPALRHGATKGANRWLVARSRALVPG